MIRLRSKFSTALLIATSLVAVSTYAKPDEVNTRTVLKVCADPNYAPFSTKSRDGFENKVADIIAEELGIPIEYTWFPQRMGFIRNTLRAQLEDGSGGYKCDLVMGIPERYELAITTEPYYRSTYAFVYVEGNGLDSIKTGDDLSNLKDDIKENLHFGMTERSPGTLWMAYHDMLEQITPYVAQSSDPKEFPGEPILKDLVNGSIDGAFVWGPTAGYFAKHAPEGKKIHIVPLRSEPGIKFDYAISAGVRFGDGEWKNEVNELLKKNSERITALLRSYEIPLVDPQGILIK